MPDIAAAQQFYGDTLGLATEQVEEAGGPIWVLGAGDARVLVYPKPDHTPANFTVLNIQVPDIEGAVDELGGRGISFERYEGMKADERGIARQGDVAFAWFKDPDGNIVGLVQM